MIKFLNEAFKGEWPGWAKETVRYLKHYIDIANVTVHTDFDKSYMKDPTKICFYKLEYEQSGWGGTYSESSVLVKGGDGKVYHEEQLINYKTKRDGKELWILLPFINTVKILKNF